MFKSGLLTIVSAALALYAPEAGSAPTYSVKAYNMSDSTVTFYWKAAGCAGAPDRRLFVCHHASVPPGGSASYNYLPGTSSRTMDVSCRKRDETLFGGPTGFVVADNAIVELRGGCEVYEAEPRGLSRSHVKTEIVVGEGHWGTWHPPIYCPGDDSYLNGVERRIEANQGDGDDTGLNAIRFSCTNDSSLYNANYGHWGDWDNAISNSTCKSGAISRVRLKVEANQGDGDDTGANDLQVECADGTVLAGSDRGWGDWGGWAQCPAGTQICGLGVRVEEEQGKGDDTALNGLKIACCLQAADLTR